VADRHGLKIGRVNELIDAESLMKLVLRWHGIDLSDKENYPDRQPQESPPEGHKKQSDTSVDELVNFLKSNYIAGSWQENNPSGSPDFNRVLCMHKMKLKDFDKSTGIREPRIESYEGSPGLFFAGDNYLNFVQDTGSLARNQFIKAIIEARLEAKKSKLREPQDGQDLGDVKAAKDALGINVDLYILRYILRCFTALKNFFEQEEPKLPELPHVPD
jgi:hypothetical protein